jgi:hypothetical protein
MGKVRITFSFPDELLDRARQVAKENGTTFNAELRAWLERYAREWREMQEQEEAERVEKVAANEGSPGDQETD